MQKDNATWVLTHFLELLAIPVTQKTISDELQKHPNFHKLLAFSDVLNNWHVPNDSYEVPFEDLKDVDLPFITYLANKQFAVITRVDEKQVTLSNERDINKVLPADQFRRLYIGSLLVANKSPRSGEADYAGKRRDEVIESLRMPVAVTGLAVILLSAFLYYSGFMGSLNIPTALLTLFKTAGLTTAVLLLVQSIDANNPLIQKLCGGDDNKNCNAILSSKAASVGKRLSWSETGFFYFAGTWLVLLLSAGSTALIQTLAILSLLALPYTFYSIYYQWRVAKQWCVLCCAVQALLWLEFFSFLPYLLQPLQLSNLPQLGLLAAAMLTPVLLWMIAKPYLLRLQKIEPLTEQLRRFKYNKELFDTMLKEQPKYQTPADDWSIVLGNVEAGNIITMVAKPGCQPCADAHKLLDDALNSNENIQVRIVFVGDNAKYEGINIHKHLMALNELPDKSIAKTALHDWYAQNKKDYESWAKAYPVQMNEALINEKLKKQKAWCDLAEITATPTTLLNGYKLPHIYKVNEIKYMLD